MRYPSRPALAAGVLVIACAVAVAAAIALTDDGRRSDRWLRVGQANVAGWAVYTGSLEAGADLARTVEEVGLHVVGVAETCEQQLAEAERLLRDDGPVQTVFQRTVRRDHPLPWSSASDDECVYGIGLVARGPVRLTDVRATELPTLDGAPGGFDREEDRYALCARATAEGSAPDGVLVCTTHLTRGEVAEGRRRSQADHLAAHLDGLSSGSGPVLLLADLNARRGDPDIAALYRWGLADVGSGDSVDHVMVKDMDGDGLRSATLGRSDHEVIWSPVTAPAGGPTGD